MTEILPQFKDLKVRFFVAATGVEGEPVGELKRVHAFPTETNWCWQKAFVDSDELPLLGMQRDIIADAVPRHDLGEATVELVKLRPAGME
ncbi:hypothetical protein ACR9YC_12720 [Parasphingorhabdus sp. DH2-15]|uniref:hypothetical protein n=1 Tax=Parasphingorhabdus sp. DH2-15 TaxID=3444112 RepID=UPI003F688D39